MAKPALHHPLCNGQGSHNGDNIFLQCTCRWGPPVTSQSCISVLIGLDHCQAVIQLPSRASSVPSTDCLAGRQLSGCCWPEVHSLRRPLWPEARSLQPGAWNLEPGVWSPESYEPGVRRPGVWSPVFWSPESGALESKAWSQWRLAAPSPPSTRTGPVHTNHCQVTMATLSPPVPRHDKERKTKVHLV